MSKALALLLVFSACAAAQSSTVTGLVTDPSDAALPNAKLTLTI